MTTKREIMDYLTLIDEKIDIICESVYKPKKVKKTTKKGKKDE